MSAVLDHCQQARSTLAFLANKAMRPFRAKLAVAHNGEVCP